MDLSGMALSHGGNSAVSRISGVHTDLRMTALNGSRQYSGGQLSPENVPAKTNQTIQIKWSGCRTLLMVLMVCYGHLVQLMFLRPDYFKSTGLQMLISSSKLKLH